MKWMIWDIYKLIPFDPDFFDVFDLYYVLGSPAKVRFMYDDQVHEVESVPEEGGLAIRFDDKWFRVNIGLSEPFARSFRATSSEK